MCEQCTPPSSGWPNPETAIRSCPRLQALGEPTLEWLEAMHDPQLDPDLFQEERTDQPGRVRFRRQILLLMLAAITIEAIGLDRAHLLWEWWKGSSLGLMIFGCFLLAGAATIATLGQRRAR
jgi:hypothetical protein